MSFNFQHIHTYFFQKSNQNIFKTITYIVKRPFMSNISNKQSTRMRPTTNAQPHNAFSQFSRKRADLNCITAMHFGYFSCFLVDDDDDEHGRLRNTIMWRPTPNPLFVI